MESLASGPILDRADRVLTVAWCTRSWGRFLIVAAVAGAAVALAVRAADGEPWTAVGIIGDLLVPMAVGYVGLVLVRDHTHVRLQPDGVVRVRTVPLPFLPAGRIGPGEVARVEISRSRGRRASFGSRWRVELVTTGLQRHPLCFGGVESSELAEHTAAAVRAFLQLSPAPADRSLSSSR